MVGRVVSSDGGLYEIHFDDGSSLSCKPRGRFRHEKIRLLVGDSVLIAEDEHQNPVVQEILERKNCLLRPPLANLDILLIVVAAKQPGPLFLNIDKLASICEENHILPVMVVTKSDLDKDMAEQLKECYGSVGYKVFEAGIQEQRGIAELRSYIETFEKDTIAAFAGASGVGKSTLLNGLFPNLKRETGDLSLKIGRGKHTTRSVNLFKIKEIGGCSEGYLADTPGFSMLDFENFDFYSLEDLPYNFKEFVPYLGTCKYTKCTHRKEEGCKILEALSRGEISKSRHESYCTLYEELKNKPNFKK